MSGSEEKTEKDHIRELIAHYEHNLSFDARELSRREGELGGIALAGGESAANPQDINYLWFRANREDERTLTFLKSLLTWVQRVDEESSENRDLLTKLLGLNPESTKQEIIEAIDDVAPLFGDYRKKKRGI